MHHAGKIEVKVFHEAHVTNCVWGRISDDITENASDVDVRPYQHFRL